MDKDLKDKIENKMWKDAYIITLIIYLSLVTIVFIFVNLFRIFPSLANSFSNSLGGPIQSGILERPYWQLLLLYLILIIVCFVISFPMSTLMYMNLSTDEYYIKDTIEKIKNKNGGNKL